MCRRWINFKFKHRILLFDYTGRVCFRKTLHACGINKKVHILVDLGQLEDKVLLNSMQVLKVFTCENAK